MRPPLQDIEFVENYILGNMDPAEHAAAKQRIENSSELSSLLETQQCIYTATRRKALRSEIQSYAPPSFSNTNFFQRYGNWFIGGLAVLGIASFLLVYFNRASNDMQEQISTSSSAVLFDKNEEDVDPWVSFDIQTFNLDAGKGATLVGKNGTLIILAENALLDAKGQLVHGKVQAELIEALNWEDMIAYNLTTTSGGKALSSGGMIRIRYKQHDEEVFVDPERPMHIEIPTEDYHPEMMVWEGVVEDGQLDWKNPQELERYLTKIDLRYLDFIPTGFNAEIAAILPYKGHTQLSDRLVDSLYYSIGANQELFSNQEPHASFVNDCYFDIPVRDDEERRGGKPFEAKPQMWGKNKVTGQIVDPEGNPIVGMDVKLRMDRYLEHTETITTDAKGMFTYDKLYAGEVAIYASLHSDEDDDILWKYCLETTFNCPKTPQHYTISKPFVAQYTNMVNFEKLSIQPKTGGCFIDPSSIEVLKGKRFQHTFIATKEFEERLQAMHELKEGALLLDVYVKNLSQPLWKCDQLAANQLSGKDKLIFETFAEQRLTNVKSDGLHQEALFAYYTAQRKRYRAEKRKQLTENQQKSNQELRQLTKSIEAALDNPAKHVHAPSTSNDRNTGSARLVATNIGESNLAQGPSYSFSWSSNDWCNVDRFLEELGPSPWFTFIASDQPDRKMSVYQGVRKYQTIIGIPKESGSYKAVSAKNETGKVACFGMFKEDGQLYFDSQSYYPERTRELQLSPTPVSEEEFYAKLSSLTPLDGPLYDQLKAEQDQLEAQLRIRKSLSPFTLLLDRTKNELSKEIIVYNRLFDALNRCRKNNEQDV